MGVRRHLDEAQGVLISARRTAELKQYSKEVIYNLEVLIRACSRVKDQVKEENHAKKEEASQAHGKSASRSQTTSHKESKTRKGKEKRTSKAAA